MHLADRYLDPLEKTCTGAILDDIGYVPGPADKGDWLHKVAFLAVSIEDVRRNFAKYGLLDEQAWPVGGDRTPWYTTTNMLRRGNHSWWDVMETVGEILRELSETRSKMAWRPIPPWWRI